MAVVIKWSNKQKSGKITLNSKQKLTVGRSDKSDVKIGDDLCSSKHMEISRPNKHTITIKDLDSKNGVFLNGTRIIEEQFYLQDELKIGSSIFSIIASELSEDELEKLSYDGDVKSRLSGELHFKVEEVPYEPRGTRRTKDLIEENYNLNSRSSSNTKKKPTSFRKLAIYFVLLAVSTAIFYYWFSSRYRIAL